MDFNSTSWNANNGGDANNDYSAYQDGQGGDDDIQAAIRASLASLQQDETNRNKYNQQSSVQDEDAELAMALKLSAEIYQSSTKVVEDPNITEDLDPDPLDEDEDEDEDEDDKKEKLNEPQQQNDYQFSDDDGDADFDFDENAEADGDFEDAANEEFEDEYEDDEDEKGGDYDGWGGDDDLIWDDQTVKIEHKEETNEELMKRLKEKRRREQSKIENFWKCGKCQFLNHPSRPICMMCNMPELDVVHHILQCPKNELKICIRCAAYVVCKICKTYNLSIILSIKT